MKDMHENMHDDDIVYSLGQEKAALTLKQKIRIKVRLAIRKKASPLWLCLAAVVLLAGIICLHTFVTGKIEVRGQATENPGTQLTFVGDVMLGRGTETNSEKNGYDYVYSGVKHLWNNSDYVFANLEGALLVGDEAKYKRAENPIMKVYLSESTKSVKALVNAGFNAISYANNHVADFKLASVKNALKWFDKNNIKIAGVERQIEEDPTLNAPEAPQFDEDGNPIVVDPGARDITNEQNKQYTLLKTKDGKRIGFIAITDLYYKESVKYKIITTTNSVFYSYVSNSAKDNDLTVVYMHWGSEYVDRVSDQQREIAHLLIDAGADIVIGSHPHVLQEAEVYNGKMIFYSLGNFIMDQNNTYTRDSAVVQYNETKTGEKTFTVMPIRINSGCPEVTVNPFYTFRINKAITSGLDKSVYTTDSNGNIVITVK